jgi:voltage-gated potassium channel
MSSPKDHEALRDRIRKVIHESDTPQGRRFDKWLILAILLSLVLVMVESMHQVRDRYGSLLKVGEAIIVVFFSIEYGLRVWSARKPLKWALSFYGLIDLLAILPSYLSLLWPGLRFLVVLRAVRLMRIFRILGLFNYMREARILLLSLAASRQRIIVFMLAVLALVTVFGTIMFVIEPKEAGFTSIPRSIYWAIVTLTTVGYGDIAPVTALGQMIASGIMILGYAIIAIPTGIVTVEMVRHSKSARPKDCQRCGASDHAADARYCRICGEKFEAEGPGPQV